MVAVSASRGSVAAEWRRHWPLIVGFAALAIPTISDLGKQVWTKESGAHGPIILATGAWLVWRSAASFKALATPGSGWLTALGLLLSLLSYIAGRAVELYSDPSGPWFMRRNKSSERTT